LHQKGEFPEDLHPQGKLLEDLHAKGKFSGVLSYLTSLFLKIPQKSYSSLIPCIYSGF